VEVRHLRTFASDQGPKLPVRCLVPHCGPDQSMPAHPGYLVVVGDVPRYPVTARFQELALSGEDLVFAAGQLIAIVQEKYPHGVPGSPPS
jgi:hypothetical protein